MDTLKEKNEQPDDYLASFVQRLQALLSSDKAFRLSLTYYNSLKILSRTGSVGAIVAFDELRSFFRRPRRKTGAPTEKQLERDIRGLLHGKREGTVVIENENPHLTGGKIVVTDITGQRHA